MSSVNCSVEFQNSPKEVSRLEIENTSSFII
jgi:hypothetical protein